MASAFLSPGDRTCGLADIINRLGQAKGPRGERGIRWRVDYLQGLVDRFAFPAPLPAGVGEALSDRVRPGSRWFVAAVDRWCEDRDPSGGGEADRAARRAGEQEMDARAAAIGLRVLEGGRAAA